MHNRWCNKSRTAVYWHVDRAEQALCIQGPDSSLAAFEKHVKHMKKLCAMVPAAESGHGDPRGPFQPVFKSLGRKTLLCLWSFLQLSYVLFLLLLYSRQSYYTVQHLGTLWVYTQAFFWFHFRSSLKSFISYLSSWSLLRIELIPSKNCSEWQDIFLNGDISVNVYVQFFSLSALLCTCLD